MPFILEDKISPLKDLRCCKYMLEDMHPSIVQKVTTRGRGPLVSFLFSFILQKEVDHFCKGGNNVLEPSLTRVSFPASHKGLKTKKQRLGESQTTFLG